MGQAGSKAGQEEEEEEEEEGRGAGGGGVTGVISTGRHPLEGSLDSPYCVWRAG